MVRILRNVLKHLAQHWRVKRLSTAASHGCCHIWSTFQVLCHCSAATPGFEAITRLLLIVGYKLLEYTVICGREAIAMIPYFQGLIIDPRPSV